MHPIDELMQNFGLTEDQAVDVMVERTRNRGCRCNAAPPNPQPQPEPMTKNQEALPILHFDFATNRVITHGEAVDGVTYSPAALEALSGPRLRTPVTFDDLNPAPGRRPDGSIAPVLNRGDVGHLPLPTIDGYCKERGQAQDRAKLIANARNERERQRLMAEAEAAQQTTTTNNTQPQACGPNDLPLPLGE